MLSRQHPDGRTDQAIIFCRTPDGHVQFRAFLERAPSDDPVHGSGLNRPDAPRTFMMMRTGRFVDELAERIAAVAPLVVRSVA